MTEEFVLAVKRDGTVQFFAPVSAKAIRAIAQRLIEMTDNIVIGPQQPPGDAEEHDASGNKS